MGLEAAIRNVAQRLRELRPRFDATSTVDLRDTLPTVERVSILEADVDRRIAAGELRDPIEGVWSDGSQYRIAILPDNRAGEFTAVLLEALPSQTFSFWEPGMVKAKLTRSADGSAHVVQWADAYRRQVNGIATLETGRLSVTLTLAGESDTVTFIKLRPGNITSVEREPSGSGTTAGLGTGTGFVAGPGLIATNFHVIRDARRVEFYLPGTQQPFLLEVAVADPINDLALLSVRSEDAGQIPAPLTLSDANPKLGEDTLVGSVPSPVEIKNGVTSC